MSDVLGEIKSALPIVEALLPLGKELFDLIIGASQAKTEQHAAIVEQVQAWGEKVAVTIGGLKASFAADDAKIDAEVQAQTHLDAGKISDAPK